MHPGAFMNWQLPYHPFLFKFGVQRPLKLVRVEDDGRSFYRPKHEDYSRMERKFEISGNEGIFH
ncbi:hypothetical protein J1N35_012556 [Gossypium stocksii]|uniref:Uncharacterized protein n=1 Tax=Gossypium stocksii TaxID=47602 RepID=A0A9D3W5D4_9ROSI|nr:hypothetical protein J1N35_012556 [Gossypium stocksii]